jgi:hypothetical protein
VPKLRSPILGYNHNLRHKGWLFHVQTEDSGVQSPHIFTHMFHEGVIIASKKLEYDPDAADDVVKGLMQAQHKSVMKELRAGAYDAKVDAYLGAAPGSTEHDAVPFDVEDAGATIPTPPMVEVPELDEDGAISSPYAQIVVGDAGQAVISGILEPAAAATLDDTDEEINGLLSRLSEETSVPEPVFEAPRPDRAGTSDRPGTWLVSRPGQKERPFERSGPIPVPVRDDEAPRRVLTPPVVPVQAPARSPGGATPPTPPGGLRRNTGTGRAVTPPAVVVPRTLRPLAPAAATRPHAAVPPARPHPAPAPRGAGTPVLPRGPGPAGRPRDITAPFRSSATVPPLARTSPLPPVLPRSQQVLPVAPRVTVTPRRPSQENVVIARPAVVIGAPPTVIGGAGESSSWRAHGREHTSPGTPADGLFGQELISEKSLDEVIMAYLSEEANED